MKNLFATALIVFMNNALFMGSSATSLKHHGSYAQNKSTSEADASYVLLYPSERDYSDPAS